MPICQALNNQPKHLCWREGEGERGEEREGERKGGGRREGKIIPVLNR